MLALHRSGVSMEIVPIIDCDSDHLDTRYAELLPLVTSSPAKQATHVIVHTVPGHAHRFVDIAPPGARRICLTTWETSRMPPELEQQLQTAFDVVLVPSQFCRLVMTRYGHGALTSDRVHVVPHCFDPRHWPAPPENTSTSPYVFYAILGWNERKNPLGLLKAYFAAFSSDDDVLLRIKCAHPNHHDVAALRSASGVADLPMVEFLDGHYDHAQLYALHRSSHCFVTTTRGEGFNLPAFEAALVGNPVIAPNWGGHREFLDSYSAAHLTHAETTPCISSVPSDITIRQSWAEPSLRDTMMTMRSLYAGRDDRSSTPSSDRARLEDLYGYAFIGAQLLESLDTSIERNLRDRSNHQSHEQSAQQSH